MTAILALLLALAVPPQLEPPQQWNPADLDEDQACIDDFGRVSHCLIACNRWAIDPITSLWYHAGPGSCRFACFGNADHPESGNVISCGHYCDTASQCSMALMDSDLIIYPGGKVPDWLEPVFEDTDPYLDIPIASSMYGVP